MVIDAAGFSERGARVSNDDAYGCWRVGDTLFVAVADGLGGMGGNGFASRYALDYLQQHAVAEDITAGDLVDLVLEVHAGIRRLQDQFPERSTMATTLTVMGVRKGRLLAAHCGDTRLYVANDEAVTQLSEDHSEAQRLLNAGLLSPDAFANYPRKNVLESAVGIFGIPTVQEIECAVRSRDWLFIASDGAYNELCLAELREVATTAKTCEQFAAACRHRVEARWPNDNYTMVVARVDDGTRQAGFDSM